MSLLARDVMQRQVLTIPCTSSCLDIVHLFARAQISGAPIVDERGVIVGVVSATDLIRAVDQACDEDLDPGEESDAAGVLETMTARDVASLEVHWVSAETPVDEIAQKMRDLSVHRVLVGSEAQLLGMITTFDLLPAVHR